MSEPNIDFWFILISESLGELDASQALSRDYQLCKIKGVELNA